MRILLVEDEDAVRELLSDELSRQGHQVGHFRDLAGARTFGAPEALIADVKLPDGSGLELMQELKLRQPSLRVLLMSGYDRELLPAEAHYLRKPFRLSEFRLAVARLLA